VVTVTAEISVDTTNVAEATLYDEWEDPYTDTDTAFVDVRSPAVSIFKSVVPEITYEGQIVTYTYLITNTGDTTLWGLALDDDILGDLSGLLPVTMLAPGAFTTVQVTSPIYTDTTNVGTITGYYGEVESDFYGSVDDDSSAFVDIIAPALTVEKSVDKPVVLAGTEVTYTYKVTNSGDATITALALDDDMLGPITLPVSMLAPGDFTSVTATSAISVDTTNVATATGYDPIQRPVSDTDTAFVDVVAPQIAIYKSAWPPVVLYSGDVEYTYIVRNVGDTTLYDVVVEDDKLGTIGSGITLVPGETTSLVAIAPAIDADVVNVADVIGVDAWGHEVRDSDSANVDVVNPAVSLDKSVNPDVVLSGTDVLYTYVIQNTGDTTLYGLTLDDDKLGPLAARDMLASGDSWTVTAPANIVVDTSNTATVTAGYGWQYEPPSELLEYEGGTAPREPMFLDTWLTATDTAFVEVVAPAISVEKVGSTTSVLDPGEVVTYTYTVTNVGDVTLYNVVLDDDMLGAVGAIPSLLPGQSVDFEASDLIEVDTTNVVVATAADEWGHEVTDSDEWTVEVEPFLPFGPDLTIRKQADKETAEPGSLVRYTLVYSNTDPNPAVTASNFTIMDDFDGRYASVVDAGGGTVNGSTIVWTVPGPLGGGQSGSITYTMRINGDMPDGITNVDNVVVIEHPDDPNPDNNRDTERVRVPADEPFLPFTGGQADRLFAILAFAIAAGVALRRMARVRA
jgi:uncharacterized repeat protein (TIGR01451 family)